jgi:hypothetical protein
MWSGKTILCSVLAVKNEIEIIPLNAIVLA